MRTSNVFNLEEGCGKNTLDVCCEVTSCDEYDAMVKTDTAYMLLHGNFCYCQEVCYAEELFQPSFYSGRVHVVCRT